MVTAWLLVVQEKEQERTEEVKQRVEELKKELLETQVELDKRDHTHEVRVTALHLQRDEIARLKEVTRKLRKDVSIQRGEINMWATRYKRLRDGFRVLQARLAKTIRESHTAPTQSQKGELVSPPESSLLMVAEELVRPIGRTCMAVYSGSGASCIRVPVSTLCG